MTNLVLIHETWNQLKEYIHDCIDVPDLDPAIDDELKLQRYCGKWSGWQTRDILLETLDKFPFDLCALITDYIDSYHFVPPNRLQVLKSFYNINQGYMHLTEENKFINKNINEYFELYPVGYYSHFGKDNVRFYDTQNKIWHIFIYTDIQNKIGMYITRKDDGFVKYHDFLLKQLEYVDN